MKARPGLALEMVVAVYCRSGTHRSLAVAECLRHIGNTVEGLMFLAPVKHFTKPKWGNKVCKGMCEECQNDADGLRQISLECAAALWQEYRR